MYHFPAHTRTLDGKMADKLQLYNIGSIRRLQRREFVRIDYRTKLSYTIVNNLKEEKQEFSWFASQTVNISAGGLLIQISNKIKEGDLVLLKMESYASMNIPRFIVALCRRLISKNRG